MEVLGVSGRRAHYCGHCAHLSHVPPPHELSPPVLAQEGLQSPPLSEVMSVRQMLGWFPELVQSESAWHVFMTHIPASDPVPQTASPPPMFEQSAFVLHVGWQMLPIFVLQISPLAHWLPPAVHDTGLLPLLAGGGGEGGGGDGGGAGWAATASHTPLPVLQTLPPEQWALLAHLGPQKP